MPTPAHRSLNEGDSVTVSATQQITVNGDSAWLKVEASTKLQPEENSEEAFNRVIAELGQRIIDAIESHATTVIEYTNKDNK